MKQVERTPEGAIVKSTIPRAGVVLAQTPQGFHYSVIKKAFDEAAADGFMGTDEASLAERSGHEVAVVMGSPETSRSPPRPTWNWPSSIYGNEPRIFTDFRGYHL